jgi:bla regulator protein BlaR1
MNKTAGLLVTLTLAAAPATVGLGAPHRHNTDGYVLMRGSSSTISGSMEDFERLQRQYRVPFLWFRRNGSAYVIQDPKVIDQAEALFEPVRRLAPRQEEIASREEALDREEEALDAEQDSIDAEQDEDSDEDAPVADPAREEALRKQQKELGARQSDLAREERALDDEEERLDAAAEASLWQLMDRAVTDGAATPAEAR